MEEEDNGFATPSSEVCTAVIWFMLSKERGLAKESSSVSMAFGLDKMVLLVVEDITDVVEVDGVVEVVVVVVAVVVVVKSGLFCKMATTASSGFSIVSSSKCFGGFKTKSGALLPRRRRRLPFGNA